MTLQVINDTLDALNHAFVEFKAANDERLQKLEKKGQEDPLINERVTRLNEMVTSSIDRLSQLELANHRPFFPDPEGYTGHKSAFLHYMRKGEEHALHSFEKKSLTSQSDASGGYLIPRAMLDKIHSYMSVTSPIRSIARISTISTDAYEVLLDRGEAEAGWVAETAERPETKTPELQKLRIPVHQIYAKPLVSQKLLDDAQVDVEDWLAQKIADKMAIMENQAFALGDGKGKPTGILSYEIVPQKHHEWGKLEAIFSGVDGVIPNADVILDTFHALKAQYLQGAHWLVSRSALAAIRKLKDKNGAYLWQPSLTAPTPGLLVGYPVVVVDDLPPLMEGVQAIPIVFGNFKEGYQIVDRAGIHILRDPFSTKPYVEFYATKRLGGDVINFDALKVICCAKG